LFACSSLHTKLYIAECNGFRGAVLGSANLTPRGDRANLELAVEFRTTSEKSADDVTTIISELSRYASDLRQHEDVRLLM
jgi:phosphatidylserine/phosphatidylglycerophosphate/cardiolipin synthase-like enzyme